MKLFLSLVFASVSALGISREAGDDIEISCNYDDKYIGRKRVEKKSRKLRF